MLKGTSKSTTRHASTEELQKKYPTLLLCIFSNAIKRELEKFGLLLTQAPHMTSNLQ